MRLGGGDEPPGKSHKQTTDNDKNDIHTSQLTQCSVLKDNTIENSGVHGENELKVVVPLRCLVNFINSNLARCKKCNSATLHLALRH